jgi:D-erythro-7,8-dihydroneopterin triphosphate epimerase
MTSLLHNNFTSDQQRIHADRFTFQAITDQGVNMQTISAVIKITNLRLRTYIGFNQEEREKQQDVIINAAITDRLNQGVLDDHVDAALNYKVICKKIINHVETGRFLLLEKLTADLISICSNHDSVTRAEVTVDKPQALRFADSVSVTLEYDKSNQTPNLKLLEKAS